MVHNSERSDPWTQISADVLNFDVQLNFPLVNAHKMCVEIIYRLGRRSKNFRVLFSNDHMAALLNYVGVRI